MSKLILLIEDDPFLIDIYTKKIKNSGFEVQVAENGSTALKILKEKKPDLILLDIVLPEMEGWEVLRRIKEDKATAALKVVVLSNLGQRGEVEKGLKLGAMKYLIKAQHTPSQVVTEIKKILD